MEVVKLFLEEIYDMKLPDASIDAYVDSKTYSLKMSNVLKDPILLSNIVFRFLWKSTTGIYPSKLHASMFMAKAKIDGDVDVDTFMSYLKATIPIYNYINLDLTSLSSLKSRFKTELTIPGNVKEQLAIKFGYRFGTYDENEPASLGDIKQSLFGIFKSCVFSPVGYGRICAINKSLAQVLEKDEMAMPTVPNSLEAYYNMSHSMIEYYELSNLNIFNRYANPFATSLPKNTSIFDAINHTISLDACFYRTLLGATVVYWDSGDAQLYNRIGNLLEVANTRDNLRSAVLFKNITNRYSLPCYDFHYYAFDVADAYLLNFVPKLAGNYVLIGSSLVPKITLLTNKPDSSIYYCLYDGVKSPHVADDANTTSTMIYSRYIVPNTETERAIMEMPQVKKHVYIIIDDHDNDIDNDTVNLVTNKYFQEHQWVAHLSSPCPYSVRGTSSYSPRQNVLLFDQFLVKYQQKHHNEIAQFAPNKRAKNVIVMVDNRPNIFSVISVYISLSNLRHNDWAVCIVCNKDNIEFYKKYFGTQVDYITKFNLPSKSFVIDVYNDLVKDPLFWGAFNQYNKLLFIQDDGMVVKPGLEEEFIEKESFAYVGAPWRREWAVQDPNKFIAETVNKELVGNGGVSLRDIKQMKHICETYRHLAKSLFYDRLQQTPEDVFFSGCCVQENMRMPSYEKAQRFACEQVCNLSALAFHKHWVYHDLSTVENVFNGFLHE